MKWKLWVVISVVAFGLAFVMFGAVGGEEPPPPRLLDYHFTSDQSPQCYRYYDGDYHPCQ